MSTDLGLSESLGGLRIANPDEVSSPSSVSAHSNGDRLSDRIMSAPACAPGPAAGLAQMSGSTSTSTPTMQSMAAQVSAIPPGLGGNVDRADRPRQSSQRNRRSQVSDDLVPAGYSHDPIAYPHDHPQSIPTSSEDWKDRGAAIGLHTDTDSNGNIVVRPVKKGVKDFVFGRTLGEGSYSTVVAATDRETPTREYAIKILDKRHIIKEGKVKYVNIEKNTLNLLTNHPGIVRLYYTFQDERSLYFALDLASNGELLGILKESGTFSLECTRFYAAEILDAVDYMHRRGVIHRDLKPENVLLDRYMHVKITDFGTAKILDSSPTDDRANSFVGTAEYVSPELLTNKSSCKASDLWAFGCILFQLLAGRPPFKGPNEYQTFRKIVNLEYRFPDGFPPLARDLIERLLVHDPIERWSIEQIKSHPFFEGVEWGVGLWKRRAPPITPYVPLAGEPIQLGGHTPASHPATSASALVAGSVSGSTGPPPIPLSGSQSSQHAIAGVVGSVSQHSNSPLTRQTPASTWKSARMITAVPPPTQLDIEWSAVLTRPNERILKLGNLTVTTSPRTGGQTARPAETTSNRLSRFFSGTATKKRTRLVLLTTCGRIILSVVGGNDKKAKMEIALTEDGVGWKTVKDAKGFTGWSVDTRDKHTLFEDPKSSTLDLAGTFYSSSEWIDAIERSCELAKIQDHMALEDPDLDDLSATAGTLSSSHRDHSDSGPGPNAGPVPAAVPAAMSGPIAAPMAGPPLIPMSVAAGPAVIGPAMIGPSGSRNTSHDDVNGGTIPPGPIRALQHNDMSGQIPMPGPAPTVLSGSSTPSSSAKSSSVFRHLYGSSANVAASSPSLNPSDEPSTGPGGMSSAASTGRKRFSKRQSRVGPAAVF